MYELIGLTLLMFGWKYLAERFPRWVKFSPRPFVVIFTTVLAVYILDAIPAYLAPGVYRDIFVFTSKLISVPFVTQILLLIFFVSMALFEKRYFSYLPAIGISLVSIHQYYFETVVGGKADALPTVRDLSVGLTFISGAIGVVTLGARKLVFWINFFVSFSLFFCGFVIWIMTNKFWSEGLPFFEKVDFSGLILVSFAVLLCVPNALVYALKKSAVFSQAMKGLRDSWIKNVTTAIYECIELSLIFFNHTFLVLAFVLSVICLFEDALISSLGNALLAILLFPLTKSWIQDSLVQLFHPLNSDFASELTDVAADSADGGSA